MAGRFRKCHTFISNMSKSQDIRSFFGASTTKKRKVGNGKAQSIQQDVVINDVKISALSTDTTTLITEVDKEIILETTKDLSCYKNLLSNAETLMGPTWWKYLEKECKTSSFQKLVTFLTNEEKAKKTIYPPAENVFATLRDSSFEDVKVVILGQDPYHQPNQAHGLSFSVRKGIPLPPSLRNIYKEAINDVNITKPKHGCLTSWSQQGVILLNAVLTVRRNEANSHKNQGWEKFTDAVIRLINENGENVVFLLWGKPAQDRGACINTSKHLVIKSSHPSPLGATKTNAPFIGSKCFSKTNEYLIKHGKTPIDWNIA